LPHRDSVPVGDVGFVFRLDRACGVAPYMQIVNQARRALLVGALRAGDRLPTTQAVADELHINRNTVAKAYRQLELEGLVSARQGVGTFVSAQVDPAAEVSHMRDEARNNSEAVGRLAAGERPVAFIIIIDLAPPTMPCIASSDVGVGTTSGRTPGRRQRVPTYREGRRHAVSPSRTARGDASTPLWWPRR